MFEERVNNFEKVKSLLEFTEGSYYKFVVLTRTADCGDQKTYREFYAETMDEFNSLVEKMKFEAQKHNARVYMVLNRQSVFDTYCNLLAELTKDLKNSTTSTKRLKKALSSVTSTSRDRTSNKYVLYDVDTKDLDLLKEVESLLGEFYVSTFESVKGYHVVAHQKFDTRKFNFKDVEVKKDALVLVYA